MLASSPNFTPPSPSNRANAITTGQWRPMPWARPTVRPRSSPRRVAPSVGGRIQFPKAGLANLCLVRNFPALRQRLDLSCQAGLGLCSTRRFGGVVALDEGPSLDLDPKGCLPLPSGNTNPPPGITCLALKTDNRSFTSGRNPPRRNSPKPRLPVPPSAHTPGQFQFPKSPTWPDRQGDRSPPCGSNRGFAWRR